MPCIYGRTNLAITIQLSIDVLDDFHVGTGAGRGRATDAVVLVDQRGIPFLPGSAIKGLCKWQAIRLIEAYPALGPKPDPPSVGPVFEIFGGGTDRKHAENRVWFDHAYPADPLQTLRSIRTGRSARDRISGRARDKHLFFYEDAEPTKFRTTLTCDDDLSPSALLLLILALRRIEAIGGQRRRGKGRCSTCVRVTDAGNVPELAGLVLPADDGSPPAGFCEFARSILAASPPAPTGDTGPVIADFLQTGESPGPTSAHSGDPPVCWVVFGYAESPLTLAYDQALDNTIDTQDFIAGASLRGALAWQAIRNGLSPDSDLFQQAFVREAVHFGPLYPGQSDGMVRTLPMPLPLSFYTCKRFPGAYGTEGRTVHGLVDRFHVDGDDCVWCQASLKPAQGYYQLEGDDQQYKPVLVQPPPRVFQRTAIDEGTGRSKDGQLYSLESLQRGTWWAGYVWGPQDLLESLFQDRCGQWTAIRVGKAKSRGQGWLKIQMRPAEASQHPVFPHMLPADWPRAKERNAAPVSIPPAFFITLYSDLIAVDPLLRPVTRLTVEDLWRLLGGHGAPPLEIERGYAGTRRAGGFLGVPGVPRSADLAIAAGSTWRCRWKEHTEPKQMADAWQRVTTAQNTGIGLRRGEGYGRLLIDLPLHAAVWDDMTLRDHAIACSPTKPLMPESSQRPQAAPTRWMRDQLPTGEVDLPEAYRRLFAELAQNPDPIAAARKLLADPLHRQGKAKNLAQELKRIGFSAEAPSGAHPAEEVEKFRQSLLTASGGIT